jgi:hypothetical protein
MRPVTALRTKPATAASAPEAAPAIEAAGGERLAKRVAALVPCSRTEAEQYIEGGWVKVNGKVVEEPQFRIQNQTITIDPNASLLELNSITMLMHKPADWVDGTEESLAKLNRPRPRAHLTMPVRCWWRPNTWPKTPRAYACCSAISKQLSAWCRWRTRPAA